MAKVDVVIPCYNYGRFLHASVASVLEQSVADLRVLIIDDASSDDSPAIARACAERDSRVSIVTHARNWGHIRTYNEGIAWASADYFLLLSADDMLVGGALGRAVSIMDAAPDIVLTHGKCIGWNDEFPLPGPPSQQSDAWSRQDLLGDMCTHGGNLVRTPTAIVRTSAQKAAGGYRTSLPHSADMEMWLRLAARGSVARLEAVQAIYRKHAGNMSIAYYDRDLPDLLQAKQAFDSFFLEFGAKVPGARLLQEKATRALARKAFWRGAVQACHGRVAAGRALARLAFELDPGMRHHVPLSDGPAVFREAWRRMLIRARGAFMRLATGWQRRARYGARQARRSAGQPRG